MRISTVFHYVKTKRGGTNYRGVAKYTEYADKSDSTHEDHISCLYCDQRHLHINISYWGTLQPQEPQFLSVENNAGPTDRRTDGLMDTTSYRDA